MFIGQKFINMNDWFYSEEVEEKCLHPSSKDGISCDICYCILPCKFHVKDYTQGTIVRKYGVCEIKQENIKNLQLPDCVLDYAKNFFADLILVRKFRGKLAKSIILCCIIYGYYANQIYPNVPMLLKKSGLLLKNLLKCFKIIDLICFEHYPQRKKEIGEYNITWPTLMKRLCIQYGLKEIDYEPFAEKIRANCSMKSSSIITFYLYCLEKKADVAETFYNDHQVLLRQIKKYLRSTF